MSSCIFCKIISGELPVPRVYEDDTVIVINDIAPQAPVHLLIIPKKHVENIVQLTEQDFFLGEVIFKTAQRVSKNIGINSFKLLLNNGFAAGQTVFHMHAHLLAE